MKKSDFGEDFLWGVTIAAIQNEGASFTKGKGLTIWDTFSKRIGKIKNGDTPSHACDFYHRYKEDLLLAKQLGFKVFRFSIAWSRILPEGQGRINKSGINFYHQVIDECLTLGLTPYITLYHWDLPHDLEKEGGWCSHFLLKWFSRFVTVCAENYGSKVKNWIILNEPMGFTTLGYMLGIHAPGKMGLNNYFPAIHNAALAQAEGGRIIRELVSNANIGTTFSCSEVMPFSDKEQDIKAAARMDLMLNRLFIEPLLGKGLPHVEDFPMLEKMLVHNKTWKYTERLQFDFDYIGIQNYFALTVKHNPLIPYLQASEVKAKTRKVPYTDMGWEINAESCYRMIKRFWDYGNIRKLLVTEGGAFFKDKLINGTVDDAQRIQYFQEYLEAVLKAKREGVNVGGYFAWTLTDNFEWSEGYQATFGLIHVDFSTQQRTIKNSGYWWRQFLKS